MITTIPRSLQVTGFLILTTFGAWMALDSLDRLGRASDALLDQPFELVGALLEAHDHAFSAHTALRDAVANDDPIARGRHLAAMESQVDGWRRSLTLLAERHRNAPGDLAPLLGAMGEWSAARSEVAALLVEGRTADARRLLGDEGERSFRRQHEVMSGFLQIERDAAATLRAETRRARRGAEISSLVLAIIAGAAASTAVLGHAMFVRAHRPLMRLRKSLLALAEGDRTVAVPHTDAPGTIGLVARAVARLKQGMAERDAATAALRLSEDRLKAALSIAPVAVFNLDRDLRYTWMYNPQVPIPAGDFLGRTGDDFFEPVGFAQRKALYRHVLATGAVGRAELVLRLKGAAEPRHFDQIVAPLLDRDGMITGLTCAAIDVTDRVEAKRELEGAVAAARRADAAKARFLAAASHDLRQPLQALRLFLDLMAQRFSTGRDREIMAGAQTALSSAEELMRNYLDVSVLESGILRPSAVAFPVADVLREAVAHCAAQAAEKGITLRLAACSATVVSDPRLLANLMRNLVANAVRFTDRGGVLVGCRRAGDALRIEVWDSGIGIPEDQLAAVFEDFYQIGNRERDRTKGLGLGLSVVDRVARLLGHPVSATSHLGKGSRFAVTVPLPNAMGKRHAA